MLRVELRLKVLILSVSLLTTVDCKNLLTCILPLTNLLTCSQRVLNWDCHWYITVLPDSIDQRLSSHALHGFLFGGCRGLDRCSLDRCRCRWGLQHEAGTGLGTLHRCGQRPLADFAARGPARVRAAMSIRHHSARADATELAAEHHRLIADRVPICV